VPVARHLLFLPAGLDKPHAIRQSHRMNKRSSTKARAKRQTDPYLPELGTIWPTVLRAYDAFKHRKPIIEFQVRQKVVLAYPALAYINDLTDSTREQARRTYREAVAAGRFMVFIRDTTRRVFRSYVFAIEEPEEDDSESTVS